MNQPLVSIVIPLFNREALIADCIASCQAQTYSNIEMLVVDDCSTDNSVAVVQKLMRTDSRIKLYQNSKNQKLGYTRNVGIRHATGDFITFLDSDDLFLPSKIDLCVKAFYEGQADCVNAPVISRYYNRPEEVSMIVPGKDAVRDYLRRKIVWKVIGPMWSRAYLNTLGWFIEGEEIFGSEDYEFHLRALLMGCRFHYLTTPLSVQVNLDPQVDTVKIRQSDKFAQLVRKKIFSRVIALKNIFQSCLPIGQKLQNGWLIARYLLSILKRAFNSLSLPSFLSVVGYFLKTLVSRKPPIYRPT